MKKIIIVSIAILFNISSNTIMAQQFSRYRTVVNTPTAYTLPRGNYQFGIFAYDRGGIEMKTVVGLTDMFYMGISFDMEHAIGKDKVRPNIPGVIAKLKLTDGPAAFPISLAVGYDSFYMGATEKVEETTINSNGTRTIDESYVSLNQMVYCPYFVITKPIYILDEEQHISAGIRVPVQPNYKPDDTSYFASVDVPLGQYFAIMAEAERVYWDFDRSEEWLVNVGFRYNILAKVGLQCNIAFEREETPNRSIRIEYSDTF